VGKVVMMRRNTAAFRFSFDIKSDNAALVLSIPRSASGTVRGTFLGCNRELSA
jgi:hypothetical protein